MIQLLFNSYGNITPLQLDTNDKRMKEQWDPSTPIIYLFAKIQEGVDNADADNAPYTVNQVLAITFNHVFRTGTMQNACERWTSLNQTHKTWAHFQTMFAQAHETYESLTTQAGGYLCANNAYIMAPTAQSESFYSETADALANLAMAATADKYLLSTLTSTNTTSTGILREKDILISALQAQLRNSNTANPSTTSAAKINYRTPVAPPGSRVIFHEKPQQRRTWAPRGVNGFYLGPAMDHYRCHRVYCSSTGQERIFDTVEFMSQHCKIPGISSAEAAVIAATDLTHVLLHPAPAPPFQQIGSE
jgi:hypothetical protein